LCSSSALLFNKKLFQKKKRKKEKKRKEKMKERKGKERKRKEKKRKETSYDSELTVIFPEIEKLNILTARTQKCFECQLFIFTL
jgi:nitrate reductase cytochrome c-type subunit